MSVVFPEVRKPMGNGGCPLAVLGRSFRGVSEIPVKPYFGARWRSQFSQST